MNTLIKVAMNQYELGSKRAKKTPLVLKVAKASPSMGVITNKGVPQPKKINQPPNGNMPLKDGEGKKLGKVPKKKLEVYRPMSDKRKMGDLKLKLKNGIGGSADSGRKMKPGQPVLSNGVGKSIRKMKSGQPKLKMSTGGKRKMKGGQQVQRNALGSRV